MEKSIKNHLCKYVRGCGLSKEDTHKYIDQIETWYDSCGVEWTVSRLKDYHHWYISLQAGKPQIPEWYGSTKSGYPKGIMKIVFNQRNPQRALALLSVHTAFVHVAISRSQTEKFVNAINAPELKTKWTEIKYEVMPPHLKRCQTHGIPHLSSYDSPGFDCLTGTTIPCGGRALHLDNQSRRDREQVVKAYCNSWLSVPDETLRFIGFTGQAGAVPLYMSDRVNDLVHRELSRTANSAKSAMSRTVGKISFIQEPSLKARVIANPNRIAQHYMRPLQEAWGWELKQIPSDCTFNQEKGVQWVKEKLQNGVQLSSTDLSSATDLLDLFGCLDCVHRTVFGLKPHDYHKMCNYSFIHDQEQTLGTKWATYLRHVTYFCEMSRARWESPVEGQGSSWKRGQPLGTAPSFFLLGLTNNSVGYNAAVKAGLDPWDSFRVIGDDIIMDSRMESFYREMITRLGAEINDSKCISSNKVVEFAGRVITKSQDFLKRVKFKEISDNQFIKLVGMLGDQSVSLLKPRQKRQWNNFKYVPGFVVSGPYSPNSQNEPLSLRYDWYLRASGLSDERSEPEREQIDAVTMCNTIYFTLKEVASRDEDSNPGQWATTEWFNSVVPQHFSEDFQSSIATALKTGKGDPRLPKDGKTMLEVFEDVSTNGAFQSYLKWKQQQTTGLTTSGKHISPLESKPKRRKPSHENGWSR